MPRTPVQAIVGLAILLTFAPLVSGAPTGAAAETGAGLSAEASLDTHTTPPEEAATVPDATAETPDPSTATELDSLVDEAGLPDKLRDASSEEPLARLSADAQANLEASSRSAGAASSGHRASATASGGDLGQVGAMVEALPEPVREAAPPALAAAGVLALFQAFGWWRALGLGGVALYSRLSKSELLDNESRDDVYKLVQAQPGVSMSEIGERLGLGWGTVVYHLDRLERAGFVASERSGLHRCFFPVGTVPRAARESLGALKAQTTRSVAGFLVERPGASQTDLCDSLGLSASAASKQITKLEKAGLVRRDREWKTVHLYPEPALLDVLGKSGEPVSVAVEPTAAAAAGLTAAVPTTQATC